MRPPEDSHEINIRDLYPRLTEPDLKHAEENFERWIALETRVYERLMGDPEAYARFRELTASPSGLTIDGQRSKRPTQPSEYHSP